MGLLDKYNLYNAEGRKMFTVIPSDNYNKLLGIPKTPFVRQEYIFDESELRRFKADKGLLLEQELNLQMDIFET